MIFFLLFSKATTHRKTEKKLCANINEKQVIFAKGVHRWVATFSFCWKEF
jgi:hypothetical protein